jgi:hypothetical protein
MTTEIRVELEDIGGRTKMVMTHAGIPKDSPGVAEWTMAFDKLAAYVATRSDRMAARPTPSCAVTIALLGECVLNVRNELIGLP